MGIARRVGNTLFGRGRKDRELQAELEFHRAMRADQPGPPLGSELALRERARERDLVRWLDDFFRDFSLALRALRRTPGFAAVAILTLALGIGASAGMFTVVDAVALRPLPFPQPEQLVSVLETSRPFPQMGLTWPDYLDLRDRNRSFSALALVRGSDMVLTHAGPATMVLGERVTANYFSMLGAKPEIGRVIEPSDDRAASPDVVVVSDAFFRSRLGGDASWLGRPLDLDGLPRTLVGVMPPGFAGLAAARAQQWTPLGPFAERDRTLQIRSNHAGFLGIGRLRAGVSLEQARADLASISAQLAEQYPASNQGISTAALHYLDLIVGSARPGLWALLAAVSLLLLVACANVANLLLARAAATAHADAVRSALGAGRLRLLRQHLAASFALALLGMASGLAVAEALLGSLRPEVMALLPRGGRWTLDGRILMFTLALALATTLLCGWAPAWMAARRQPAGVLQLQDRGRARMGIGTRGALVAGEIGLALLLLVGAGLLLRSWTRIQGLDRGFNPEGALSFVIGLPEPQYPRRADELRFFRQAQERLAALPGVAAAGGIYPLPFANSDWEENFSIVGRPAPAIGAAPSTNMANVRGAYFQALGARLLRGRRFTPQDTEAAPPVAIVDDTFARRYFPGADPLANALGARLNLDGTARTIVGIVAHTDSPTLKGSGVQTYVPQEQSHINTGALWLVVRSRTAEPAGLEPQVRRAIAAVDANQPIDDLLTMDQRVAATLLPRRLTLALMLTFAALGLALAAAGIYGVLSYAVAQRTREMGIRMALGANAGRIQREVLVEGLRWALLGTLAGLGAALALARLGSAFLFEISARDPLTLACAPLGVLGLAALACYLPARRATRIDPVQALRG